MTVNLLCFLQARMHTEAHTHAHTHAPHTHIRVQKNDDKPDEKIQIRDPGAMTLVGIIGNK